MFHVEHVPRGTFFIIDMNSAHSVQGNILDLVHKRVYPGVIIIEEGTIHEIIEKGTGSDLFITPGLIDAHVHIESSMLTPQCFAEAVIPHGTTGLVSDPHEIANVLGLKGVEYMIRNAEDAPVNFFFGAPSCVPATSYEMSGGEISGTDIEYLFRSHKAQYLAEVMNYPGVINGLPEVLEKINIAKKYNLPMDGHAPGITGDEIIKYIRAGIDTDHECVNYKEAVEKIHAGMKILIREGSAAKNFNALFKLINNYPEHIMFCSDDLHPDDLIKGHINLLVKRALELKADLFNVFKACTINPIKHYRLNAGLLQKGDPADIVVFNNYKCLKVVKTISKGNLLFDEGQMNWKPGKQELINNFHAGTVSPADFLIPDKKRQLKIIKAIEGQLFTKTLIDNTRSLNGTLGADLEKDYLKIAVVNRYKIQSPAIGFVNGFGLKRGAIAGSVAHDSHNIICIGTSDETMAETINWIVRAKGGLAVHDGDNVQGIQLPIAGIISDLTAREVAEKYTDINRLTKSLSCHLYAPFMTMSFMALLVIPELKISDKGLFDGNKFELTDIYV
jgi:adenine deaminase